MTYRHPARTMLYRDLTDGLRAAVDAKLVSEKADGNLRLYNYTPACVYDRAWTPFTLLARGLVLDAKREAVVATPFEKFFNHGERPDQTIPDLSFEVFEKLDGSLIVAWHDGKDWRCSTRGSFDSTQAAAGSNHLAGLRRDALLPGHTYLFEWVAPDNRIVVRYDTAELVLLAQYDAHGNERSYPLLQLTAGRLGCRLVVRHDYASVSDLISRADDLPATEEGFVVRFWNGLRLKIKGEEYRRVHALISGCTPLGLWRAMEASDDLDALRRRLPEEFWPDFDAITTRLGNSISVIIETVAREAAAVADLTDKEVGLRLASYPEMVRRFLFPYRKAGGDLFSGRSREALFREIRPTGNRLDGYEPSYAINRVQEDVG